jgi:hypothetical protein
MWHYRVPHRRRPLDARQWEPGQLVNSVDHASTPREYFGADFPQSTPDFGKKKES